MAKKRLTIAKSASVQKNITGSLDKLAAAVVDGDKAVAARSKISKKLNTESRRLSKKTAALLKRKKTATAKAKAAPSVETRKNQRVATVELAVARKAGAVLRAAKAVNSPEFAALKVAQRQANAYAKAIAGADKVLNKPKKKRRKRAAKKA